MGITFAGESLLLPDSEHQLEQWLDFALPLDDMRLFGEKPVGLTDSRDTPRGSQASKVGLPRPNWPEPPKLKINSLYIPTGATRWAVGLFLVDRSIMNALRSEVGYAGSGSLVLDDTDLSGNAVTVTRTMYMLPEREASNLFTTAGAGLCLLPLVDARYWWQWKHLGDYDLDSSSTWADLFAEISTALGVTVNGTAGSNYFKPDPVELTRPFENAAVMLDAVAASIGQRVVFSGEERLDLVTAPDSEDNFEANIGVSGSQYFTDERYSTLAGDGVAERAVPATVTVAFPKYVHGNGIQDDYHNVVENPGTFTDIGFVTGTTKVIFTSAVADFTSGSHDNASNCNSLANQIASDFYAWIASRYAYYDVTYGGIRPWAQAGFDNYTLYHFGSQSRSYRDESIDSVAFFANENAGEYTCFTRVCSLPLNWGVSEQLQQVREVRGAYGMIKGLLKTAMTSGDSTHTIDNVEIMQGVDPRTTLGSTSEEVTIYNIFTMAGDDDGISIAVWNRELLRWEFIQVTCPA